MEMRIAVIGAGISGISISRMLHDDGMDVTVFERENKIGGLIKCQDINGNLFHQTGGHVFNTKYKNVEEWFWKHFDKEKEFTKANRNSSIAIDGDFISYPIENHIYQLGQDVQKQIIENLLEIKKLQAQQPENFEDFLRKRFGEKLYEIYFQPYNFKIWRKELSTVPLEWLEGKLPMPTVEEILFNNFNHVKEKAFVHSTFYYPLKGGSQFIADRLATGLNIKLNSKVETLKQENDKWLINGETFDKVIFCGNIKQLPLILDKQYLSDNFITEIEALEGHGTTAVFCAIDTNDYSWVYLPSREHESHRIICTGNFSKNNNQNGTLTASIEFTNHISIDEIHNNLAKIPFSPQYLSHHYEQYTYPIQDKNTREMISSLKHHLENYGMYLLGRFAEWEYYNMDVAIHAAMTLKEQFQQK